MAKLFGEKKPKNSNTGTSSQQNPKNSSSQQNPAILGTKDVKINLRSNALKQKQEEAAKNMVHVSGITEPITQNAQRYRNQLIVYREIYPSIRKIGKLST